MTDPEDKRVSAVQIRAARFEDAGKLARMRLALQQHMQASNPRLLAMSRQAIANLAKQYCFHLENPMRRIIVAEDCTGTLIGMAMGTIADRDDLQYCFHLENPMRRIIVAEDCTGTLIGMAMGTIADRDDLQPPRCGRIDDVWVEPRWRRQGLAKQLIGNVLAFFESNDVATLVLDYSVGNIDAECTWNALGFEPILTVAVATPYELRRRLSEN